MKRSLKEIKGYALEAVDGEKGKVKNFLFDEETWIIRYLEVDIGGFFSDNRVLIPINFVGLPDWDKQHIPIQLTTEMLKNSPDLEFDLPISRKYEKDLLSHYDLKPYWPSAVATYSARGSLLNPEAPFKAPGNVSDEEEMDTSLRSFNEIRGYYINAIDERFGHIDDLIIEDDDWYIHFVVIDTKNLAPWSKKVMLPVEMINEIRFFDKEAIINLPKESIKNAPEYDPAMPVNADYERVLYDFYGRKIIK